MDHYPISLSRCQRNYLKLRRIFDLLFSLFLLLLLSPLLLVVILLLKIESPTSPVIFRQKRMGKDGRVFTIYKFRTMHIDAPAELSAAKFVDSRNYITKLGHILRSFSIDELPQLVNILRGDMSFLGPRPLLLAEESVHRERLRCGVYQVRPGLSGLAQVHGRDLVSDACKVMWDCRYVEHIGIRMDIGIFFESILAVLFRWNVLDK